jgi:hypothetical protein
VQSGNLQASCPDVAGVDMEQLHGLVEAHAYPILEVREIHAGALMLGRVQA